MIIAILDSNECNFSVKFDDASQAEKVKKCMREGLSAWYCASNGEKNDVFTEEEIAGFYWAGYAEPTQILLDRYGIDYEITDVEVDGNDKVIADEVIHA